MSALNVKPGSMARRLVYEDESLVPHVATESLEK